MRAALAGLTTRGRSFLAAGLATCLCALTLAEVDLLRVGVFLVVLPLLSALAVSRTRYRLTCARRVDPARVQAGASAEVTIRVENLSRLPTGVLLAEDRIPYTLGGRPRFVLNRVESRGTREFTYPVRSDVRGRFVVGPLTVRLTDAFGLVELTRAFTTTDNLIVTPTYTPLPAARLGGEWSGGGHSLSRAVATAGEDDVATREYRLGDDLRRVHWRSTARYQELMVRREEQPWQSRGAILLDTRAGAHRGDGPGSSFEWAVSATASIGVHLGRAGYDVRMVTDLGAEVSGSGGHDGGAFEAVLLDSLALVEPSAVASLSTGLGVVRRGGGELVVAVLGAFDEDDLDRLVRYRHGTASCVAVVLDTAAWGRPGRDGASGSFDDHCRMLSTAGWRVLRASPRTDLRTLWVGAGPPTDDAMPAPSTAVAGGTP